MGKYYGRKEYKINNKLTLDCIAQDTSYGFRHLVDLLENGRVIGSGKACYYNRTWESYEYQSVIYRVIDASNIRNKQATKKKIDAIALGRVNDNFKTVATVMALGDIFSTDKKSANDWKTRMLKAGLPEGALHLPEDWDTLDDNEKETRLNKVIAEFTGK